MSALRFMAVGLLGLLAGALSLEGLVLVPHWRSLSTLAFADLHAGFAPRLFRFFAPLTTAATSTAFAAAIAGAWTAQQGSAAWCANASAIMAAALLAVYRLYFHAANERLPLLAEAGDEKGLAAELLRWQRIHLARTALCITAFASAALGVSY